MPQPADIAHLLRRAGFGGTAAQIATLAVAGLGDDRRPAPRLLRRRRPTSSPRSSPTTLGDWEKEFKLQAWWLDRMATTTTPLQEKLTLFWHGHFATANYKVADTRADVPAERAVPVDGDRQLPRSRAADVAAARDAHLARQRPEREGQPERELRPGADGALHARRRPVHARTTSSRRPGRGPGTTRSTATARSTTSTRTVTTTGSKTFMGVTQNWDGPDIIDFILGDDADAQADRGPVHRHEDVVVLRVPESRRRRSSPTSPTRSSPPTSSIARRSCGRSSTTRPSSRRRRSRGSCARRSEWVVACMRAVGITADGREPAVVDGRHGPAALRAAERLGLAAERVLAHDVAPVVARELVPLHHLAATTSATR